jgi:hypothetical protein
MSLPTPLTADEAADPPRATRAKAGHCVELERARTVNEAAAELVIK